MNKKIEDLARSLEPCRYCGGHPKLYLYQETCDGRGDQPASIKCTCGISASLTTNEYRNCEKQFGYTGGYLSQNEEMWYGMHKCLVDKWNRTSTLIFVIGSIKQKDQIKTTAENLKKLCGCDVAYVCDNPFKSFECLVNDAFDRIEKADQIVVVRKPDGSIGDGTTYEVAYARRLKKPVIFV